MEIRWTACLYVALGGAIGSLLRYLAGLVKLQATSPFPFKTLMVNVIGSFLIGLIAVAVESKGKADPALALFLKVGICGGFTTFSTFALESVGLIQQGHSVMALLYMASSALLSIAAVFAAQAVMH